MILFINVKMIIQVVYFVLMTYLISTSGCVLHGDLPILSTLHTTGALPHPTRLNWRDKILPDSSVESTTYSQGEFEGHLSDLLALDLSCYNVLDPSLWPMAWPGLRLFASCFFHQSFSLHKVLSVTGSIVLNRFNILPIKSIIKYK